MPPISERLFPVVQETYTSDDYYTPKWIFDALGISFDLDVACPPDGPLHTPCSRYLTQEDDGLSCEWQGSVFMNPPFSKPNDWAYKFIAHRNGVCLVPVSKSKWFDSLWENADAVVVLPSNLRFEGHQGEQRGSIFIACAMFAYGASNVKALEKSKIGRVR